jgi:hypothetical protein
MAESDAGRSANGTVSTEEAERLSERFRPSWEDDPADPPLSAAITRPLPIVAVTAATNATVPQVPAAGAAPVPGPPQPTLVGISPEPVERPGGDLETELPTDPSTGNAPVEGALDPAVPAASTETVSSAAQTQRLPAVPLTVATSVAHADEPEISVEFDVDEPPASKPSGIGEKYVPKEEGAPPVVLNEDVKAAEVGAQAALEAQHRARRAPTIARLKAIDIPLPPAPAEDPPFVPPRRSGAGKLVALSVVVLALAAGAAMFLRSTTNEGTSAPAVPPAATTVAADTAAPPPPAPTSEPTVSTSPATEATPTSAAHGEAAHTPAVPNAKEPRTTTPRSAAALAKPAPAPKAAAAPKAGPVAAKPAPKAGSSSRGSGKAVIVRDSPF